MATVNPQLTTVNFWKTFDLLKFQKELDQVALEIANRQDESDLSRQKLVEQSREFKKNTPEDVKKYVGPLFKNFQQEIDSLSKRSKSGEAAFLAVYKQIIDFVDPSPLIEQCERLQKSTQKVKDLELENKLLRDTLEDCNKDLAAAKQSEETVRKLELKLKETDKNINAMTEAAVFKIREELESEFAGKLAQSNEEKAALSSTIDHLRGEITMLRTSFDSVNNELQELRSKYDEYLLAKNCEIDMLAGDIEKLQARAQTAEAECEKFGKNANKDFTTGGQYVDQDSALRIDKLEKEIENKEIEVRHLIDEINGMKLNYNILEQTSATKIAFLNEQVNHKNTTYEELERRLSTMSDYSSIKRELSILKSMEFFEGEINSSDGFKDEKEKPLEILVMEKNKTLKVENSTLKTQKVQLTDDCSPTWPLASSSTLALAREDRNMTDGPTVPSTKTLHQIANYYAELFSKWESNPNNPKPCSNSNPTQDFSVLAAPTPAPLSREPSKLETKNVVKTFQQPDFGTGGVTNDPKPVATSSPIPTSIATAHNAKTTITPRSIANNDLSNDCPLPNLPKAKVSPTPQTQCNIEPETSSRHYASPSSPSMTTQLPQPLSPPSPPLDDCDKSSCKQHSTQFGSGSPCLKQEPTVCEDDGLSTGKEYATPPSGSAAPRLPMTDDIAKTVREALCFHQIGQRVFAKYILGLSQGTVSELLSKPKPWERLSGKGRESYRKMHAWVSDQTAILALKSLAPKRAKDMPQNGVTKKEDKQTKEKIVDILCKAQKAMMHKDYSGSEETLGSPFPAISQAHESTPLNFALNGDYAATFAKNGKIMERKDVLDHPNGGSIITGEEDGGDAHSQAKLLSQKTMISKGRDCDAVTGTPYDQFKNIRSPSTASSPQPPYDNCLSSTPNLDSSTKDARSALSNGLPLSSLRDYPDSKVAPFENVNLATAFMYKMISAFKNPEMMLYGDGSPGVNPYAPKHMGPNPPYQFPGSSPKSHDDNCDDLNCCASKTNGTADVINQQDTHVRGQKDQSSQNEGLRGQHHPFYDYAQQIYQQYKGGARNQQQHPYSLPLFAPPDSNGRSDSDALTNPANLAEFYRSQWESFYNRQGHSGPQLYNDALNTEEMTDFDEAKSKTNGCSPLYNHNGSLYTDNAYSSRMDQYSLSQAMWANIMAAHSNHHQTTPTQSPLNLSTRKKEENLSRSLQERDNRERNRTHSSCSTSDSRVSTGPSTSPLGKIHSITMSLCPSSPSLAVGQPKTTSPWQSAPLLTPSSKHGSAEATIASLGPSNLGSNSANNNNVVGTKSSKSCLPPVPQELFAARSNLNTEDIVRRVKEHLAKYSISQRAFGEMVLGLSQGSVSDLLARPKPWSLLTQKGREPFIRMQIFLDDGKFTLPLSTSIHKRSSSAAAHTSNPLNTTNNSAKGSSNNNDKEYDDHAQVNGYDKMMVGSKITKDQPLERFPKMEATQDTADTLNWPNNFPKGEFKLPEISPTFSEGESLGDTPAKDLQNGRNFSNSSIDDDKCGSLNDKSQAQPESNGLLITPLPKKEEPEDRCEDESFAFNDCFRDQKSSSFNEKNVVQSRETFGEESLNNGSATNKSSCIISPSPIFPSPAHLMELTAVSGNLDTLQLTSRIKEILINFNIGQKVFGEAVLGLSQGSVSELLSKPKPWHMLSLKGREPFIRMHFWLNDVENIEKLKSLKQKKKSHTNNPSQSTMTNGSGAKRKQRFHHSNSEEESFKANDAHGAALYYPRTISHSNTPSPLLKNFFKHTPDFHGKSFDNLPKPFMLPHYPVTDFDGSPPKNDLKHSAYNDLSSPAYDFFDDDELSNDEVLESQITSGSAKSPSSPALKIQTSTKKLLGTMGASPKKWFTSNHHAFGARLPATIKSKRPSLTPQNVGGSHSLALQRSTFSLAQKAVLKQVYQRDSYPSTDTISALAIEFNVPARSIINWFHNHRMRLKAQTCVPKKVEHEEDQPASVDEFDDSTLPNNLCKPTINTERPPEPPSHVQDIENSSQSPISGHELNGKCTSSDLSQSKGANDVGRRVNKRKANIPTKVEHKKSLKTDHPDRVKSPFSEPEALKSQNISWGHSFEPCQNEYQRNSGGEAKMLDPTTPSYMMTSLMP